MAPAIRSSSVRSRKLRRTARQPRVRRPRRSVPAPRISRAQLLRSWASALEAAETATDVAFQVKALDADSLRERERRLRAERDWLGRFADESALRFP
jgi:hypothetical protein